MQPQRLLVVEDDDAVRMTIELGLQAEGYTVDAVSSTREAIARLNDTPYPIVISDIYLDERTGLDVLEAARGRRADCAVILMTARGTMETVMAATRGGAFDYIAKPFDWDKMLETVKRAEASFEAPEEDEDTEIEDLPESEMIGSSSGMVGIYKIVSRVAPTDATVLLEGETGTGKELIARMIHRNSKRAEQPFAPVDCGAVAPALLESELFGALKGSYTGADRDRLGVFEAAHRGTVFLDEIGDVELNFQLKLLRFLQEREIRPLGAPRAKVVDVRVVAATNKNVQRMVDEGKFREDLWFRLNVVRIVVPPLRERRGDVALLAHHFLRKYNERYGLNARLTESGLRAMEEYAWPGNVRQLQHMMERLTVLAPQGRIDEEAVRDAIEMMEPREEGGDTLADKENEQIRRVLAATGGNKSRAAKILGIERKTLYRKLKQMGLL
ncbi:MAG: sigma-54-dependent Fis family transcriptional regulator [Acidobacteria bacterium]|nr:sigma-54-dependent Fis family transcriptional regulator [Acidobacteriota bacterium]